MLKFLLLITYAEHMLIYWYYSYLYLIINKRFIHEKKAKQAAIHSLQTQLTILPIMGYIFYLVYSTFDKLYILGPPVFSMHEVYQWILMFCWEEMLFYHFHKLLHTPRLYHFHKKHHEWISPIPWVALYASPVENVLVNFLPVLSAPLIVGLNVYHLYIWIAVATLSSVMSHTVWFRTPHNLHHKYFYGNYGALYLLDRIRGTYLTDKTILPLFD